MTTTINHLDDTRHHAGAMDDETPPDPEVPERSLGRRQFAAKYKGKVLTEYDAPAAIHSSRRARAVVSDTLLPVSRSASSQEQLVASRTTIRSKQSRSEHLGR
jgi:hypothetical protein